MPSSTPAPESSLPRRRVALGAEDAEGAGRDPAAQPVAHAETGLAECDEALLDVVALDHGRPGEHRRQHIDAVVEPHQARQRYNATAL